MTNKDEATIARRAQVIQDLCHGAGLKRSNDSIELDAESLAVFDASSVYELKRRITEFLMDTHDYITDDLSAIGNALGIGTDATTLEERRDEYVAAVRQTEGAVFSYQALVNYEVRDAYKMAPYV